MTALLIVLMHSEKTFLRIVKNGSYLFFANELFIYSIRNGYLMYSSGHLSMPTCLIHLIFLNKLVRILQRHWLPLLNLEKVQQVAGAHLSITTSVLPIDHINFLTVSQ